MNSSTETTLDSRIAEWRSFIDRRQGIHPVDIDELEDHLRQQVGAFIDAGLDVDEAFLVAVKRMGALDELSREFAREHSERLWKQLVMVTPESQPAQSQRTRDTLVAFGAALVAALLIKVPSLFGLDLDQDGGFYARNLSLFVLPVLSAYFVWKRRLAASTVRWIAAAFVLAAIAANIFPFIDGGSTETLTALHLPISLWLAVGIAYAGDRWNEVSGRMDFIRFSGELFIYFVLIALGGGLLMGFTAMIFGAIGVDVEPVFESWLLPCGAAGGVIIAAWLVEAKQSVIENMAPVLTRLFTPLFAAALLMFLGTVLVTGRGINIDRDVLIAFDLLLVVVLALLLYSVSARDPHARPGLFDVLQVALVISALAADALALWSIAARISEFGFTPNRVAAMGENVILLVNLTWSAVLYIRFLRHRGSFSDIEIWQTRYLPVYAVWAAVVVLAFPPLFAYM